MTPTLLQNYPHQLGGHCGSAAMRDLMEWNRLGWNGALSEGLVFTLGGALNFSYARSSALTPPIYLVGRGGDFEIDLPRRLGATVIVRSTDDPERGWQWVRDELEAGRPVLAWADISELPYLRVRLRMSRHDIVIIGYDDDLRVAHVVDNDRHDVQLVPYEALARARSSQSFPVPTRHTIYDITWPTQVPDLRSTAADAFERSAEAMTRSRGSQILDLNDPHQPLTGLDALQYFADDIGNWSAVFNTEPKLDHVLTSLATFIEKAGTGGGLFRRLLAGGCADVAAAIGQQDLRTRSVLQRLSDTATSTANTWSALATTATSSEPAPRRAQAAAKIAARLPVLEAILVQQLMQASQILAR